MGLIRADIEGLSALAANCQARAGALAGSATPPKIEWPTTSSTAAVAKAHTTVQALTARLAERMQSNADKFSAAATGFAHTETASALTLQQLV